MCPSMCEREFDHKQVEHETSLQSWLIRGGTLTTTTSFNPVLLNRLKLRFKLPAGKGRQL